ncbi:mediator of RNA polymerase II transcription subunit 4 [Solea senegalensis]|uniref:Mediator of RNA polymerase II transcription subunit 4 n=1 Tax=Solea senegalensis TaxID=28829 RepID=A0AAV6RAH7_SOLSE|nr:mediator of RNA polymerase II transcription subunit 4 [Solea senegalensis]
MGLLACYYCCSFLSCRVVHSPVGGSKEPSGNMTSLPALTASAKMAAGVEKATKDRLLSVLGDVEVLSRELIEMLALSRNQKLLQPGEDVQKQLKEAEHILATAVYQAKEKLKSIDKARKGSVSSEEIIKYAHRISASNAVCAPLNWLPGDPRRPYPTDLEMRSGILGHMANMPTNGVNGHLPGDALTAGRLPDVLTPHYPWQSSDVSVGLLPPHHGNDFVLEPPGHNKENEDDVEAMSTDSSSSSSDSD